MTNTASATFRTPKLNVYNLEPDIISALVRNKEMCATFMSELDHEFFEDGDCKTIFKVIKTYFSTRHATPTKDQTISFIKKIEAKTGVSSISVMEKIGRIYDRKDFETHELTHINDELIKFIKSYKVKKAISESIDVLDQEDKFHEIEEKIRNAVLWTVDKSMGTDLRDVEKIFSRIEDLFTNKIETPWEGLNKIIGGGFFSKTISIVAASSSVGKSIFIDNVAIHCWKKLNLNVILLSLELSEDIKGMRIYSSLTQIDAAEIAGKKNQVLKYYEKMGKKDNYLVIKEYPSRTISAKHISSFIRKVSLHKGKEPDIIIIDYMDLMLPNSMKRLSLYEDGGDVSEQARWLGYEYNCPVVTATQLNRLATNLEIDKIDEKFISESQKKQNTADNLLVLGGTQAQRKSGQLYLKSLKARQGKKDEVLSMKVDYPRLTLTEDVYKEDEDNED